MDSVKAKAKRRSSEKRRLKAKESAQIRRTAETELFQMMISLLPLKLTAIKFNYTQAIRISIAIIHHFEIKRNKFETACSSNIKSEIDSPSIHDALHGFFIILSSNGNVIFVTDNISKHIGISQQELLGSSLYDYLHHCDIKEVRSILTPKSSSSSQNGAPCAVHFLCRVKCTLTHRGTVTSFKSAPHRVIQFTGRHLYIPRGVYLMALCEPVPHPTNIEVPLGRSTFLSRHDPCMVFTYCDDRMSELVGFTSEDVLGHSVYEYHHACDTGIIQHAHKDLFAKGQCISNEYRFLVKHGGYVQMMSQSTVIYHDLTNEPHSVISVNFVLSGVHCRDLILSHIQVPRELLSTQQLDINPMVNHNAEDKQKEEADSSSAPKEADAVKVASSARIQNPKIKQPATESLSTAKKFELRMPVLPKGQDIKLWSKIPKYGIFGGMKLPIGATESVIISKEDAADSRPHLRPCNPNSGPPINDLDSPTDSDLSPFLTFHNLPASISSKSTFDLDLSPTLPDLQLSPNNISDIEFSPEHLPDLDLSSNCMYNLELTPSTTSPNSDISVVPDTPPAMLTDDLLMSDICQDSVPLIKDKPVNRNNNEGQCTGGSMLKHLLLYGTKPQPPRVTPEKHSSRTDSNRRHLSHVDCERYAPTQRDNLLYGQELLDALDS